MVEISEENGSSKSLTSKESPLDILSGVNEGSESGNPTVWLWGDECIGSAVSSKAEIGPAATS